MRYEMTIFETGHRRFYDSFGVAKAQGVRLFRSLVEKGVIFGRHEFDIRDMKTGETQTITMED
jgi:hypothetical protein